MPEDPYDNDPPHDSFDGDEYAAGSEGASPPPHQAIPTSRVVYCTNCGVQLDGLRIGEPCPNCQVPVGASSQNVPKSNGKSIAALVLGICSFVGCLLYGLPGIVCGILAIFFAKKVRRGVAAGEMHNSSLGMANAGRVCGIIGLCLSIAYTLLWVGWVIVLVFFMIPQQQQQMQQWQKPQPQQWQQTLPTPTQPTPATLPDPAEPETPSTNP